MRNLEVVPPIEVVPLTLTCVRPIVLECIAKPDPAIEVMNIDGAEQMNTVGGVASLLVSEILQLDINFGPFAGEKILGIGSG